LCKEHACRIRRLRARHQGTELAGLRRTWE
jgi:hypothetical protein